MSSFAILRVKKHKTSGSISASSSHMMRTRPTKNADPFVNNRILSGSDAPDKDVKNRLSDATQIRKNSVLAIEIMASASPEWFETATKAQKTEWVASTRTWLENHFGKSNVAHLQLHLDESTPHITGFIVPIDPDSGRLNAARWLDGSAKLADMQTEYANVLRPLGLVRGLEGSEAEHTTIQQFYGAIKSKGVVPVAMPELETPPFMMRESTRNEWAKKETRRVKTELSPAISDLKSQAKQGIIAARKAKAYQDTAEKFRDAAMQARDIPLQEIAEKLGLTRSKTDKEKWVDSERKFSIKLTDQKWFDHKNQVGKGGAIDLTMHVLNCDYKRAISWLGHDVGKEKTAAAIVSRTCEIAEAVVEQAMIEETPFSPPPRSESGLKNRHQVANYLVNQRGLDRKLVARMSDENKLYADERGNAVFLAVGEQNEPKGAEIRGTGLTSFHGLASGSDREFCFEVSTQPDNVELPKLVLVESAIDALSYAQMYSQENLVVASTAGARPNLPRDLQNRLNNFSEIVVAYDNDKAGLTMAEKLIEVLRATVTKISRSLPNWGKDWNDSLRHLAQPPAQTPNLAVRASQELPEAIQPPPRL